MFTFFKTAWSNAATMGRILLILALVILICLPIVVFYWLNTTEYQPVFSNIDERDAAAIIEELEQQEVPYILADEGKTIQVAKNEVYKTRMRLLSSGMDLKGVVGFELFNNSEFGMTEFAQKINYQRALQGELARTIMGFDEVQNVRVHLVLPESTLLRKNKIAAKASVWVTLREGRKLTREQVTGIQRLIAASVPELQGEQVTVLDQRGVALSWDLAREEEGAVFSDSGLQIKKEIESYLLKKVNIILNSALGEKQFAVSVDVVLDQTKVKILKESMTNNDQSGNGIVVRKREQWQGEGSSAKNKGSTPAITNKKVEMDYLVGKETQQIQPDPISTKRISVGVITQKALSEQRVQQLTSVIAMAIGINKERGDAIAFSVVVPVEAADPKQINTLNKPIQPPVVQQIDKGIFSQSVTFFLVALVLLSLLFGWIISQIIRHYGSRKQPKLSVVERKQLLGQVKIWLAAEATEQEQG